MDRVRIEELRKLPYVQKLPTDTRVTLLRPFYDHDRKDWVLYIPVAEDEPLGRLAGGEPVVGSYFAKQPADSARDLHFPLGTFVAQCASYTGVVGALESLESDIFELACILRTYDLITSQSRADRMSVALLLSSELAYLIISIRALYDVLQRLSKNLLQYVKAPDGSGRRVVGDLDDSFARVLFKGRRGDQLRTREELESRYGLPPSLADFYATEAPRFKHLRDLRVALEHHGHSLPTIFCLEHGAAVLYRESPWSGFGPWDAKHIRQDKFGSVHWLFATLAADALDLTTRYLRAFGAHIAVQQPLSEGIQLYLRHPFGRYLVDLPLVRSAPWEWETTVAQEALANKRLKLMGARQVWLRLKRWFQGLL